MYKFRMFDEKEDRYCYITIDHNSLVWASKEYTDQESIIDINGDVQGVIFKSIGKIEQFTGKYDDNGSEIYE